MKKIKIKKSIFILIYSLSRKSRNQEDQENQLFILIYSIPFKASKDSVKLVKCTKPFWSGASMYAASNIYVILSSKN